MIKRQIVIYSGFNRAMFNSVGFNKEGIHNSLTTEWINPRAEVWKRFTWRSILNQTYGEWVYCLCCHKDAKDITDQVFEDITDERFFLVYSDTPEEKELMNKLVVGNEQMVNVRIDSDDCYHRDAIAELSGALYDKKHDWFLWRNGFCYQYNEHGHRMKEYRAPSGPFFAKRYTTKEWLKQDEIKIFCQHRNVLKLHDPKILSDGMVLVGITGFNSSTLFKMSCFKSKVMEPRKSNILKEFGIYG